MGSSIWITLSAAVAIVWPVVECNMHVQWYDPSSPAETEAEFPIAATGQCNYTLDVAQLVDASQSEVDSAEILRDSIVQLGRGLWNRQQSHEARYALYSFTDKPILPFGHDGSDGSEKDFCLQALIDFSFEGTEDDVADLQVAAESIRFTGGHDYPEGVFEAMLRTALFTKWKRIGARSGGNEAVVSRGGYDSASSSGSTNGDGDDDLKKPHVNIMVVMTDAPSHLANGRLLVPKGSRIAENSTGLPANDLLENPEDSLMRNRPNAKCGEMDYPSLAQLGEALRRKSILPVFVLAPPIWYTLCTDDRETLRDSNGDEYWKNTPDGKRCAVQVQGLPASKKGPLGDLALWYKMALKEMNQPGVIVGLEGGWKELKSSTEKIERIIASLVDCSRPDDPRIGRFPPPAGTLPPTELPPGGSSLGNPCGTSNATRPTNKCCGCCNCCCKCRKCGKGVCHCGGKKPMLRKEGKSSSAVEEHERH